VRWSVGTRDNNNGDHENFPWSMTFTARSGDAVSLRACNECDAEDDVTITTTIRWQGSVLATQTHSGEPRVQQCKPQSAVSVTLP